MEILKVHTNDQQANVPPAVTVFTTTATTTNATTHKIIPLQLKIGLHY